MQLKEIKAYLKKNNITYVELSEKSGLPLGTLKNIFAKCSTNPRIDTIQAIEKALGLNDSVNVENQSVTQYTAEEKDIIEKYRTLPEKLKKLVRDQLEIYSSPNEIVSKTNKKV